MNRKKKQAEPIKVMAVKEEKELFAWKALSRPYQKKDRDFWVTALASAGLVCVILFVIGEWGLIAAILSLLFFYYVLTAVKPEKVSYRITTKGVYLPGGEQRVDWDFLKNFYFGERWGHSVLKVKTFLRNMPIVSLVVVKKDEKKLTEILEKYLPEGEEEKNAADKISNWVYKRLPFEVEKSAKNRSAPGKPKPQKKAAVQPAKSSE